jgi:hypothetical protein
MSEIIGVLFAMIIGVYMLTGIIAPQKAANDTVRAITAAQQQKKIYAAAAQYIEQNANTIQASATASSPVVITVPMLQAVVPGLAGMSATNPYGQTWQVEVLQPPPNNLQTLVMSTGGDSLPDKTAALVARYVNGPGGFIPRNDTGAYPAGASAAYGNFGGWNIPTAGYTGVSGGHLAALLTFVSGQVSNNFLYRNAVPGQPQYNQMNTTLDLNGNDITNGKSGIFSNNLSGGRVCAGNSASDCSGSGGTVISSSGMQTWGNTTTYGVTSNASNNWGFLAYDGNSSANAAPQSNVGSGNINDLYLRSIGKWISQIKPPKFKTSNISFPASDGCFDLTTYLPTVDQATATQIQITLGGRLWWGSNVGPFGHIYMDNVEVWTTGFDTTSSNENIETTTSLMVAPGPHCFSSYITNGGYFESRWAIISGYSSY